jgi:hypothetical protein
MSPHHGSGSPWQRFGGRILTVGATWGALALVSKWVSPALALAVGVISLALAARAAWHARRRGKWNDPQHQMRRQVTLAALLTAAGMFYATASALRDRIPPWAIWMELGALVHYLLLTLA